MKSLTKFILITIGLLFSTPSFAQDDGRDAAEELKLAAVEALIMAPADKALPLIFKVLAGDNSAEVKESALFILSQIDFPEAQEILLKFAREENGELQLEAIRMIGIGGNRGALANLTSIYETGNGDAREAVLEALMIAGDKQTVYEIAVTAEGDDFEYAVEILAVMGARDELRQLRSAKGASEALIEACAISGDFECLRELALDSSDIDMQTEAIESMGIVGGSQVGETLVEIYRGATSDDIREAALDGMMIGGYDEGMLELYRSSDDASEKKDMLDYLVMMGSDEVWAIIGTTLDGNR